MSPTAACSATANPRDCYNDKKRRAADDLDRKLSRGREAGRKSITPGELTGTGGSNKEKKKGGEDF